MWGKNHMAELTPEEKLLLRRRMNVKARNSQQPKPDDYSDVEVDGRSWRDIVKDAINQLRSPEARARKLQSMDRCNPNPAGEPDSRTQIQKRYPNINFKSGIPKTPHPNMARGKGGKK